MAKTLTIRPLRAEEIELRVGQKFKDGGGASYLLYKDARCDMKILDELFTPFGWIRDHKELKGNIYCGVSIKNEAGEWISKWDCGAESNVEKEKGEASDSFKRACFNWGIGVELYTAPNIRIKFNEAEAKSGYIWGLSVGFIETTPDKQIVVLDIVDATGASRYAYVSPDYAAYKFADLKAACKTYGEVETYWRSLNGLQQTKELQKLMTDYYISLKK